jgi:hypothetical protein
MNIFSMTKSLDFQSRFKSSFKLEFGTAIWWVIGIGLVVGCSLNYARGLSGFDWVIVYQRQAIKVDESLIFNPLWIYFILKPIAHLPMSVNYIVFTSLNLVMIWLGSKLTGAKKFFLLFSFPVFWLLWFGQLDGFVLLGAALGWKAFELKKPVWMGWAILLLLVKPHIGAPLAGLYFLLYPRWESIATVGLVAVFSMLVWGWDWPYHWVWNFIVIDNEKFVPQATNISLYPYGLISWAALLVARSPFDRAKIVLSATLLSMPYAAAYSILPLLIFPLPNFLYILASAPLFLGQNGYRLTTLVPILTIILVVYPLLQAKFQNSKNFHENPET